MITAKQPAWHVERATAGLLVAILLGVALVAAAPAGAQPVTVRAVDLVAEFAGPTTIAVDVVVENVRGAAGLQFSIDYPSTLIATENPSTHENGGLWSLLVVNHDNTSGANPPAPGFRRISVSAAAAEGRDVDEGLLMTLEFEVGCFGFAQDYPEGRQVVLDVRDVLAFDENGATLESAGTDGTLTLDCTTVSVESPFSFGTMKAFYDTKTQED